MVEGYCLQALSPNTRAGGKRGKGGKK